MRLWDSSALIPLLAVEASSDAVTALLAEDHNIVVAFITPVEVVAALARRGPPEARHMAAGLVASLTTDWHIVTRYEEVVGLAQHFASKHGLRAGDAIQLATANVISYDTGPITIVTLDRELAAAARAEGFPVLP